MATKYNKNTYIDRYASIIVNRIIDDNTEQDFFLNCLDDDIWREVNDLCNRVYLKNNNISTTDVAIRCRELIQDIYNIYIGTGEFIYEDWHDTENRGILHGFSNHKDPYSYSDSNEQLSASIDKVCFAITSNQLDTLLDSIVARFEHYRKPFPHTIERTFQPVQDATETEDLQARQSAFS